MSLQQQIESEELENSFLLFDCTGKYSGDNKGGYGTPNYKSEDIFSYVIEVQPPSATDPYPFSVNVLDSLPNNEDTGVEVQPSQIGMTEIESGKWKFRSTTVFNTKSNGQKTIVAYHTTVFIKSVACCIDSKTPSLNGGAINDQRQLKIMELSNLLEGVKNNICNGLYDEANKTIEYLNAQCKCPGC